MYIMAIKVASAIDGQISEDDKETWLSIEEFKTKHIYESSRLIKIF